MDHEQLDLTGLTEDQKKAIATLVEKIAAPGYFLSIWDYPPNKIDEFRRVNQMKESEDPEERARGKRYEATLLASCRRTQPT